VEVTENDQPELFAFIRQVADDCKAPHPGKVFLSADVNASVSYDSSFWSMFFPVKKNLEIGLGLVNSLSISEFKAVLAHEFGHFSQRSMKLGSYVYNVNRIIHNMLFENTGYARMLNTWANISNVFAFFSTVAASIARGIQKLLGHMYAFLNRRYSGLSLQMEYQADAVAASVSGSESLVTALRRIDLANSAFQLCVQHCNKLAEEKRMADNFFPMQKFCMGIIARQNELAERDGLPEITDEFLEKQNLRRVIVKDQWASHPPLEDRVRALRSYNVQAAQIGQSPWQLFRNPENIQARLTAKLYGALAEDASMQPFDLHQFEMHVHKDMEAFRFPKVFHEFYEGRRFSRFTAEEFEQLEANPALSFDSVFSAQQQNTVQKILALQQDMELLQHLLDGNVKVKTFDFDGQKYRAADAAAIRDKLSAELSGLELDLRKKDAESIQLAMQKAVESGRGANAVRDEYLTYFRKTEQLEKTITKFNQMMELLVPIYSGHQLMAGEMEHIISQLKSIHEPSFKQEIIEWKQSGFLDKLSAEDRQKLENFLQADWAYFDGQAIMEQEFIDLHYFYTLVLESLGRWSNIYFRDMILRQFGIAADNN
jgi:Zn-dependent protease with chaperone function